MTHRVDGDATHIHANSVALPLPRSEDLLGPRQGVVQLEERLPCRRRTSLKFVVLGAAFAVFL